MKRAEESVNVQTPTHSQSLCSDSYRRPVISNWINYADPQWLNCDCDLDKHRYSCICIMTLKQRVCWCPVKPTTPQLTHIPGDKYSNKDSISCLGDLVSAILAGAVSSACKKTQRGCQCLCVYVNNIKTTYRHIVIKIIQRVCSFCTSLPSRFNYSLFPVTLEPL